MNARNGILFFCLLGAFGCSQSPSPNSSTDFTDPNARYSGNVSEMYAMTTISSALGFDIKWKDSNDIVRSLAGYHDTVVLLTFWRTSDVGSDEMLRVFDSVAADFRDSVRIVMFDDDNSSNRFANASTFVNAQHFRSQVIVDSPTRAHLRFAGDFAGGPLVYSETFVIKRDGSVLSNTGVIEGWNPSYEGPRVFFDSLVRAAYR